jgi:hypothetical protein
MSIWDELPRGDAAARRPLPREDASISALPAEGREILARLWAERAQGEFGAAAVFSSVSRGLFFAGAGPEILWLASRAVCDELRHAEICLHVAARYAGRDLPRPPLPEVGEPPPSPGLYAVLNCSLNETIGSAVLTACHEEAEGPLARAASRELLADEIDHARIGWSLLAEGPLGKKLRCEVACALPALVRAARGRWLERALDEWENKWFAISDATLKRRAPEVHTSGKFVFLVLELT